MTDPTDHGNQTGANVHRAETNRAYAKHSTGPGPRPANNGPPSTPSAMDSPGHVIVLPSEDHTAYETHTRRLFHDFQPKGAPEEQLVQSLTDTSQRINRSTCRRVGSFSPRTPFSSPESQVPSPCR